MPVLVERQDPVPSFRYDILAPQALVTGTIRLEETPLEEMRWTFELESFAEKKTDPVILEGKSLNIWKDYLEFNEATHEVTLKLGSAVPPDHDQADWKKLQDGLGRLKKLLQDKHDETETSVTLIMANSDMVHCMKHLGKRSKWWYYWLGFQNFLRDLVDSIW